jgi:hypothetical protein
LGLFVPEFQSLLAQFLPQCRYAKDLETLLAPGSGFHLHWTDQEVRLENYYQPAHPDRPYTGVCYELTYQLGKALQKAFGKTYLLMAADGNCAPFYEDSHTNHTFILATPWGYLNTVIQHFQAGNTSIPPKACLIDPSFQRWGFSDGVRADPTLQSYQVKGVYDFEAISPQGDCCEVLPFHHFENGLVATHTLPLGLLSFVAPDLMPGEGAVESADPLVVFGFQRPPEQPDRPLVFLGGRDPAELYPVIRRDWEAQLPPAHPLNRFLGRLREALAS